MSYEHVFDQLEIAPDPFAVCELKGRCDLGLGQDATATLHYILRGTGSLHVRGAPDIPVGPGCLILVPALQRHSLRSTGGHSTPVPDCKPAELNLRHLLKDDASDQEGQLIALCAHVRVGLRGAEDVIDLIRNPMVERIAPDSPLRPAMDLLLHELCRPGAGSRAMIRAVLTQCLIEMLRRRLQDEDGALRWMAALRDPQVWEALRAMLDAPGDPHTVDSLAERVGLSRSAFANRFSAAYGSGPIDLLRDLRLRKAATLLRDTNIPVKRVAHLVGFSSRTAFSRLFEQRTGQSPLQFRKDHAVGRAS
ncbi:MAG: AraC family transcriptional regulator [Pelagimonas sp.]|jgi:AraC-like DNA-binding protein|nr:AraC family transcriptional regulator [Pelagimonas sp.]